MSVMEKFRATGKYSPSLLGGKTNGDGDEFDTAVNKVLDANGTSVVRYTGWTTMSISSFVLITVRISSPCLLYCLYCYFFKPDLCLASGPSVPDDFKNVLQVRHK
jgi:hypothetical protein